MKTSRTTRNPQNNNAFGEHLRQLARSECYRQQRQEIEGGRHPAQEWLHAYVWEQISEEQRQIIRNHLPVCAKCMKIVLRLRQIKDEMEQRLSAWSNAQAVVMPFTRFTAEEYWEPVGTGEALVAASSAVTQEHYFTTPVGVIHITCAWGQEIASEPGFIWLSWLAEIPEQREFIIRLLDPEQQAIRYEIRPGKIHQGEQTFTSQTLGFNPVSQKWSIGVLVPEIEA